MKRIFIASLIPFSLVILISMTNCPIQANAEKPAPCKFLSNADAQKILGQPVKIIANDSSVSNDKGLIKCTYRGVANDNPNENKANLYFILEESLTNEKAKEIYKEIWDSNKNHPGIEVLSGIGDEAYSHSDKPNFHFVMARKGKFTVRLKINKAVEVTSLAELKDFAERLVEKL